MDENKLKVLRDIGYTVKPCCGLCTNSEFPQNDWGTCLITRYEHLKHTGDARQLSIVKSGSCPRFVADPIKTSMLGRFQEFMPPPEDGSSPSKP